MGARRRRLRSLACLLVVAALSGCAEGDDSRDSTHEANLPTQRSSTAAPVPSEQIGEQVPIAVIGDSFTSGSPEDSGESARWPALVTGEDYSFETYDVSGTGYAATWETPAGPSNYVTRVDEMPADGIDHVVFFGSINDGAFGYEATRAGAEAAFENAREKWPDADVLVIGPASPIWPVPEVYFSARDATRDAAAAAGLPFVDPIDAQWFEGTTGLIGTDGIHPNDRGHAYLADRLREVFSQHFPA